MNRKSPVISIITATYNRAHLIEESLRSIQHQTTKDWECLIIDDGSSDHTKEILKPFLEVDKRFQYFQRTEKYRKGLPGCRNMGLDLAQGEYIIFYDDDDIVHPKNLETCLEMLKKYPGDFCSYDKKPFIGGWHGEFTQNEDYFKVNTVDLKNLTEVLTGKLGFASCTVMWNKRCFETIRFKEDLMYAEEWECYSRILISDYSGISINRILYYNRKHLKSNTGEFNLNNPLRRASKAEAIKLVINNLGQKGLLNDKLTKFFIQIAFSIKDYILLSFILETCNVKKWKILTYKFIYRIYPLIRPLFLLKAKL